MRLYRLNWFPAGRIYAATVIVIAGALSAGAQQRPAPEVPDFRAAATLVLVPVTVVDRRGAIVNGLASDAFTLTEDGIRQQIRSFSEQDVPVSMGIVIDLSGSMKGVLGAAKESLRALMKNANPTDEAFLNTVSTRPRAYSGFTRDFDAVLTRMAFENAGGDTALIDTVYYSLQELRSGIHTRKVLLIISDGMDNHSRYSRQELLERALESDAQIYTIAVANPAARYSKPIERTEERRGLLFLDELAAKTGGLSFVVRGGKDIAEAAASIGYALRNQYTIGYVPRGGDRGGQWHRIKVKVADMGARAYARAGYRLD
jgi:Ca-activated chloride channel family protein